MLAITNVANRIFSGLLPSATNYTISKSREEAYELFKRLLFGNLWFASFTTVCLFLLLNPFIELWLDSSFLFEKSVVAVLCLQHYLSVSRLTASIFINSAGLFSRDKIRPLIESTINLVVSIALVKKIGIAGVFVGTCVSGIVTYYWREPYLVFKHHFQKNMADYWRMQVSWLCLTAAMCWAGMAICEMLPGTIGFFIVKMAIAGLGSNLIILLVNIRSGELKYYKELILRKMR